MQGFRLLTTDPLKPTCEAISDCKTFVNNKNLNVNGRCLACNLNYSLKGSYDAQNPANGASSCVVDSTTFCLAQESATTKCVKCISTKFLDTTGTCVNPPIGCDVPHASDNSKCA